MTPSREIELITELLATANRYSSDDIQRSVDASAGLFQAPVAKALCDVLRSLAGFQSSLAGSAESNEVQAPTSPTRAGRVIPSDEELRQEFLAMTHDSEWMTRQRIITDGNRLFGPGFVVLPTSKGLPELRRRALGRFDKSTSAEKRSMVEGLRRKYLADRGSKLSDWSAVLSTGK